jgi:hypothetical protein
MSKNKEKIEEQARIYADSFRLKTEVFGWHQSIINHFVKGRESADLEIKELKSLLELNEIMLKSSKYDVNELKEEIEKLTTENNNMAIIMDGMQYRLNTFIK